MGFTLIARHRSKDVQLWRQGGINLIANYEPKSPAAYFAAEHGPSACGMGWRVRDAAKAYAEAVARGAEPVEVNPGPLELRLPAIRGIRSEEHTTELQSLMSNSYAVLTSKQ